MLKKFGITILVFAILIVGGYIFWQRQNAKKICQNLIEADFITTEDCYISANHFDYIPVMFPIDSTREYVETGMQGFYQAGDEKYLLRRSTPSNPYSWILSYQLNFHINSEGKLHKIEFEFF